MNSTFRTIGAWTALAGSAFGGQLSPKDDGPESKQSLSALTIPERPATAYADKSEPKGALELDTSGAKLSFNASSQVVSQYRTSSGIVLYDAPGIQTSLTATLSTEEGNFSLTAWNHASLNNQPGDFTEVDLNLSYSFQLSQHLAINAAANNFLFPVASDQIKDTHELAAGLSLTDVAIPLSANLFVDVDEARYTYLDIGVTKNFALNETLSVEASAHYFHVIEAGNFFKGEGPFSYTLGGTLNWQPQKGGPTYFGGLRYTEGINGGSFEGPGLEASDGMYFFVGLKIDF
jgi:hypothetical protein